MSYEEPDKTGDGFKPQDVWHYRIEGYAVGTVIGHDLPTEESAKRWLAEQYNVDISDVVCHTPVIREGN